MAVIASTRGFKVNGLYRHGALTGESFPTVTPPSTDYRGYGSALYDTPSSIPPPYVTNRGTIVSDLFGAPMQTIGPWTTGDDTPQTSHPDGTGWAAGPVPFRTNWTAGTSGAALFMQVTRKTGETDPYTAVSLETKNAELWGRVAGRWVPLVDGGTAPQLNVSLFGGYWSSTVQTEVASPVMEDANLGRQRWTVPAPDRMLHVVAQGSPRPVIPVGATGLFARVWIRMTGAPGASRPFMGLCGVGAYASATATGTSGSPWTVGRWKTITPDWQPFTSIALTDLSVDDSGDDFWTLIRAEAGLPNTVAVGTGW